MFGYSRTISFAWLLGLRAASTRKVLVYTPSSEEITSYDDLDSKLSSLEWERYYDDPSLLQYHKQSTIHLISLPKDFKDFKTIHTYDIVVKNKGFF